MKSSTHIKSKNAILPQISLLYGHADFGRCSVGLQKERESHYSKNNVKKLCLFCKPETTCVTTTFEQLVTAPKWKAKLLLLLLLSSSLSVLLLS